ncbi:rRNA-processing protein UTP23 homolog [Lycorma delicatula]|uniref:rRNA-processing protein UTP23 homolog n=1 Tax=Lycorma delicatula TaxID=130591 RepID=UPI003F512C44
MRINRHKKVHKCLNFFSNNFGFRKPFQVLIDGTLCYSALKNKVNIQDQLKNYLGVDVKLLTTKCVILETEMLGKHLCGAMLIVKQFAVHQCGHDSKPVPGSVCFESMIADNNPNRYIIATQDRELQEIARSSPGTPVLYLHKKTPTLEQPSKRSIEVAQERSALSNGLTKFDAENISNLKEEFGVKELETKRKKKKKGGPNPLSCKKPNKQKIHTVQQQNFETGKKRRRRIRIPDHVKAELFNK